MEELRVEKNIARMRLWPHQVNAVDSIRKYLDAYKRGDSNGSALVRMPTGTGKTGLLALVAQAFPEIQGSLIVVPWFHLTRQVQDHVNDTFWKRIGTVPRKKLKTCVVIKPSDASQKLEKKENSVFVCTFQTLETLKSRYEAVFNTLAERIDCVLVDEGHREPAPAWSEAVRRLDRPTILFSATPYRNDVRQFEIDTSHVYRYPHAAAVDQNIIRKLTVFEDRFEHSPNGFVKALLAYLDRQFPGNVKSQVPRVIVRCSISASIRQIASRLRRAGRSVVAVHDRFPDDVKADERFRHTVPNPLTTDAQFWVHQFKLAEGLDDSRFRIIAIYEPFSNARALVQQVGRVLRNPGVTAREEAYLFSHRQYQQKDQWERYLNYEDKLGDRDLASTHVVQDLFLLADELQYLFGDFRQRFDPNDAKFYQHLRYSRSASVYQLRAGFDFDEFLADVRRAIEAEGLAESAFAKVDKDSALVVYTRVGPSPYAGDRTFFELSLGYAICRRIGDLLFYDNVDRVTPEGLPSVASRMEPQRLELLFEGKDPMIGGVSLINTDLGAYSTRRRSLTARSMTDLAPSLADYSYVCSTATGSYRGDNGERVSRYVGFSRGRVSERSGKPVEFDTWCEWSDKIALKLTATSDQDVSLFERYAAYTRPPLDPVGRHILLDIDDVLAEYKFVDDAEVLHPLQLDDRAWNIEDADFVVEVNGRACVVSLDWDSDSKRFKLESTDLDRYALHEDSTDERKRTLISHLNLSQAFRLILGDGSIYAHGHFYKPRVPLWGRNRRTRIDLLSVLEPHAIHASIKSEKGGPNSATLSGWEVGSLFEYIDRKRNGLLDQQTFDPDILVCDDLLKEAADFIAVQHDPPRIAVIHAKASKHPAPLSASAFHEVCSQAIKNLGLLNPQSTIEPPNRSRWTSHGSRDERER